METTKFNYLGNAITFQREAGSVMINATEMGKNFQVSPSQWFRTEQYNKFINALSTVHNCIPADLVQVVNGGSNPGTWMHEDVAMEFARWLSPSFAIWCNDRTKELLKYGATAINPDDLLNPDFIIKLATELKNERARAELLQARTEAQQEQLKLSAPKVQYFDEVLQSESLILITVIAKELGMSGKQLNLLLKEWGVQYKVGEDTWVPYAKYQNAGYTASKTHYFTKTDGNVGTSILTVWTEKGRAFIHWLYNKKMSEKV